MDLQPRRPEWTVAAIVQWTTAHFARHGIDSPRSTAELLLAHALGWRRIDLYLNHDQPLNPDERERFKRLVTRRLKREPVAYITGRKEFFSLPLTVSPDVLIPRPETETLVESVIGLIDAGAATGRRILDLGTGSGAVVVALASQRPDHFFFAADVCPKALALARRNAAFHGLAQIRFFCGRWCDPLKRGARFDVIVANPPYIASDAIAGLEAEVRCHEPRQALDGGGDGLQSLKCILDHGPDHLVAGGYLALEIGHDQAEAVTGLAAAGGRFEPARIVKDLGGRDRVIVARRRG